MDENVDLEAVAAELEGYSPADIKIVCRQAAMAGITRYIFSLRIFVFCSLTRGMSLKDIEGLKNKQIEIPVTREDIKEAIEKVKPSVDPASLSRYTEWFDTFGSA